MNLWKRKLLAFLHDPPAKPFNILILTADDMNADSPGWMGNKLGATPNLDAFAATCYRFVNCHVSAPICQPSRNDARNRVAMCRPS